MTAIKNWLVNYGSILYEKRLKFFSERSNVFIFIIFFEDSRTFARNITRWHEKHPALYHGHFAYVDFPSLGVTQPVAPIYINMIRRPLDRLISYYYFLRYTLLCFISSVKDLCS